MEKEYSQSSQLTFRHYRSSKVLMAYAWMDMRHADSLVELS